MRHTTLTLAAALVLGAVVSPAMAAGDAAVGKTKIAVCMACHGQDGRGTTPDYPHLAGQSEKYLVAAIKAYKSGARNNAIMKPMVAALADADIENVAAYYASLPCK